MATRAMHWQRCAAAALCLGLLYCASPQRARAQAHDGNDANYDALIEQASVAYREQRYEQARDLFEQAHVLQPSARTLRGLGITAFALDRYTQARPELEAALADPRKPLPREQRREVSEVLAWMKQRLGALRLELSPEHALALVDDQAASAGLNLLELGEHALSVRASGYANHEQRFVLERDVPLELRVELQQLPAAAPIAAPVQLPAAVAQSQPQPMAAVRDEAPAEAGSGSVLSRWWFWTIAGVVVATTVVAVVVAAYEPEPHALPAGIEFQTP